MPAAQSVCCLQRIPLAARWRALNAAAATETWTLHAQALQLSVTQYSVTVVKGRQVGGEIITNVGMYAAAVLRCHCGLRTDCSGLKCTRVLTRLVT